ncbi:hypothetical protein TNCV_652841 [Trichonephila clavipes]|nr:hypothetical protein TNCV_652841 [Trichonephila clavipes]
MSQIGKKVVFSDESRFNLWTDDNRVRVWRHPGERYNSTHTVLRHTAPTAGVMVWGVQNMLSVWEKATFSLVFSAKSLSTQWSWDDGGFFLTPRIRQGVSGLQVYPAVDFSHGHRLSEDIR